MEPYNRMLKQPARDLRNSQTEAEEWLWRSLRRKQIHGVQFYRQKVLLSFIVDFYCAAAKLVVELDGAHHYEADYTEKDAERDRLLGALGLRVLRFENRAALHETEVVLGVIADVVKERL
jgi:very-short-patch-repair endonuclease